MMEKLEKYRKFMQKHYKVVYVDGWGQCLTLMKTFKSKKEAIKEARSQSSSCAYCAVVRMSDIVKEI